MTPQYLEAIAALLAAKAWPLVVVVFVLTQRRPLTEVLNKLEEITLPGGIGAKLRREVDKSAETTLESDPDAAWKAPTEEQIEAAQRVEQVASRSDISVVRTQVLELAQEYERLRAAGVAGDQRRRWQVVVIKMRALARAAYDLLPELKDSESPGERL